MYWLRIHLVTSLAILLSARLLAQEEVEEEPFLPRMRPSIRSAGWMRRLLFTGAVTHRITELPPRILTFTGAASYSRKEPANIAWRCMPAAKSR